MISFGIAILFILSIPLWGYFFLRLKKSVFLAWLLVIVFNVCICNSVAASPLQLMFLYISSTFLMLKMVVVKNHLTPKSKLSFLQWCLFSYGWFGMNPSPFLNISFKPLDCYKSLAVFGLMRLFIGLLIIYFVNSFLIEALPVILIWISYLLLLIALSFVLHFGILNINAAFLRWMGINVTTLFKAPLQSKTLQEFWSRRWNIAFVELTTIAVLRPLKKKFGSRFAFWASYVFSGLLHEMAISLPVKTGFGKPFLYFVIQAIVIQFIEPRVINKQTPKPLIKLWLLCCLLLPVFILFHQQFIQQIVLPLANSINFFQLLFTKIL